MKLSTLKLVKSVGQVFLTGTHKFGKSEFNFAAAAVSLSRNYSAAAYTSRYAEFENLAVSAPCDHVLHVELNRPDRRNAMSRDLFREVSDCFKEINDDKHCRVVVLSGAGKMFSAGLDFRDMIELVNHVSGTSASDTDGNDVARKAKFLRTMIQALQLSFTSIEKCTKPVISAVHGGCIGGGLDLIAATDIRYCSQDAYFSAKEVDIGMTADLGTLQRIPKIVGNDGLIRELAFTGRKMGPTEAKECGLVSAVYADAETTKQAAIELAQNIASKSPVAVQGTKVALNYSRDHSVKDGLEFMANWNMCMLQSEDLLKAATGTAIRSDKPALFSDL